MNNVVCMDVRHTLENASHQLRRVFVRQLRCFRFYVRLKRPSWRIVHAHVELAVQLNQMLYFNNIGVVKPIQ